MIVSEIIFPWHIIIIDPHAIKLELMPFVTTKIRFNMAIQKFETFIYEDLGFPIELIDVPMQKVFGEWVLDINLNKLQLQVLKLLIQQPTPLQAEELRFIRKYLEMTTSAFGEKFLRCILRRD